MAHAIARYTQKNNEYPEEFFEPYGTVIDRNVVVFDIKSQSIDTAETIEYLVSADEEQSEPSNSHQYQLSDITTAKTVTLCKDRSPQLVPKKERRIPSHMRPKSNTQPGFECPKCGKAYSLAKNMRRHVRLECGQQPKYACPYCPLRCKRNNQLQRHIDSRH